VAAAPWSAAYRASRMARWASTLLMFRSVAAAARPAPNPRRASPRAATMVQ
jgi:hypothetical protein